MAQSEEEKRAKKRECDRRRYARNKAEQQSREELERKHEEKKRIAKEKRSQENKRAYIKRKMGTQNKRQHNDEGFTTPITALNRAAARCGDENWRTWVKDNKNEQLVSTRQGGVEGLRLLVAQLDYCPL